MTIPSTRSHQWELATELRTIRSEVDAFNPDARLAAHSAFEAAERVWKMVPKIIAALEASPITSEDHHE